MRATFGLKAVGLVLLASTMLTCACGSDSSTTPPEHGASGQGGEAGDADAGAPESGGGRAHGGAPAGGSGSSSAGVAAGDTGGASGAGDASDAGDAGDAGATGSDDFNDRLHHLGATTDLGTAPQDANGNALPSGYNPLRKQYATLDRRDEIYFAGPLFRSQYESVIDDGFSATPFANLTTPTYSTWFNATFRTAVAADVDGDGIQEFVAVWYDSGHLMAKVTHGATTTAPGKDDAPFKLMDIAQPATLQAQWFQHCVTAANLDDDPADELVVGFRKLYVFDDPAHQWAVLVNQTLDPNGSEMVSVVKGDFDAKLADPTDEVFVMYDEAGKQRYQMYDGLTPMLGSDGQQLKPKLNDANHSVVEFLHAGAAVVGQFDADDAQELAFTSSDSGGLRLMIMDDWNHQFKTFDSYYFVINGNNEGMAAADIDGDGYSEVMLANYVYSGFQGLPPSNTVETVNVSQPTLIKQKYSGLDAWQVRSGRVSPDLGYPSALLAEQFVAIDTVGHLSYSARDPVHNNALAWISIGDTGAQKADDVIAVGNIDRDSAIVKYKNQHELLYSSPELLVALAPPPFYADTNQADNSSTSFGKRVGTEVAKTSSLGYSVGFTIGYEAKDPLGIAESSLTFSVDSKFDSTAKSSVTRSEAVTYTGGAEDSVVFTVVPFDVYYYQVVSALDPSQVGNTLAINLPRKPQTLLASAAYFDRYVDESRKSAPLFATHTVGDPFSYPTPAERDQLCSGGCYESAEAKPIGQGTGSTAIETEISQAQGQGTSFELTTEVRSESKVAGVIFGASVGFSYGYSIESSTFTTTVFTGKLGSLEQLTPAKSYQTGLFAHQQLHPSSQKPVLVVDYWVEK